MTGHDISPGYDARPVTEDVIPGGRDPGVKFPHTSPEGEWCQERKGVQYSCLYLNKPGYAKKFVNIRITP